MPSNESALKLSVYLVMPFPNKKRVKFDRNPLMEVVCQLTFLTPYAEQDFTSDKIAELHDSVKRDFPLFDIQKSTISKVDLTAGATEVKREEEASYEFSTLDKEWKIILTKGFITVATPAYKNWEEFIGKLYGFIGNGLNNSFPQKKLKRVGLRYKDVINRSELGLADVPWGELLNDTVAVLHRGKLLPYLVGENTHVILKLKDNPGLLSAHYGLVTHHPTGEICFLFDSDFYIQGEIDYGEARQHLDVFNVKSRNFFQWAILEKLFRALQPRDL